VSAPYRDLDRYILPRFRNIQLTLSGGGSSAYQAAHILKANDGLSPNWKLVFDNTGFEPAEALRFVDDFEREMGAPVTRLERDGKAMGKFRIVGPNSYSRDGEPFIELITEDVHRKDGTIGPRPLPSDGPRRLCSGELKTKTTHRYLRSLGWGRYRSAIGFRADEQDRIARKKRMDAKRPHGVVEGGVGIFPMAEAGVTKEDVVAFGQHFDWWLPAFTEVRIADRIEVLSATDLSNCDNCFMAAEWRMKLRMAARPHTVQRWIDMEGQDRGVDRRTGKDRNRFFRPGRKTMGELFAEVQRGDFSVDQKAMKRRPGCGTCHD